jgi:hypothetical protein
MSENLNICLAIEAGLPEGAWPTLVQCVFANLEDLVGPPRTFAVNFPADGQFAEQPWRGLTPQILSPEPGRLVHVYSTDLVGRSGVFTIERSDKTLAVVASIPMVTIAELGLVRLESKIAAMAECTPQVAWALLAGSELTCDTACSISDILQEALADLSNLTHALWSASVSGRQPPDTMELKLGHFRALRHRHAGERIALS